MGLVNRGGAPVPLQCSFNEPRNAVMRSWGLAHCGNAKALAESEDILVSEVLFIWGQGGKG
jgi:hypothetical protein